METGTAIGLGAAAALAGGLYYLAKRRADAQQTQQTDPCAALPAGDAQAACRFARGALNIGGALFNAAFPDVSANNVQLNGSITKRIPAAFITTHAAMFQPGGAPTADGNLELLGGTELAYANGCVPYPGHPEWTKCAPGTQSLAISDDFTEPCTDALGLGATRCDPLTYQVGADELARYPKGTFPSDPGGGAVPFWVAGVPTWVKPCPAGSSRDNEVDHRAPSVNTPGLPPCLGTYVDANGKPIAGGVPTVGSGAVPNPTGTSSSSAGRVWVATPPPGHWERARQSSGGLDT